MIKENRNKWVIINNKIYKWVNNPIHKDLEIYTLAQAHAIVGSNPKKKYKRKK